MFRKKTYIWDKDPDKEIKRFIMRNKSAWYAKSYVEKAHHIIDNNRMDVHIVGSGEQDYEDFTGQEFVKMMSEIQNVDEIKDKVSELSIHVNNADFGSNYIPRINFGKLDSIIFSTGPSFEFNRNKNLLTFVSSICTRISSMEFRSTQEVIMYGLPRFNGGYLRKLELTVTDNIDNIQKFSHAVEMFVRAHAGLEKLELNACCPDLINSRKWSKEVEWLTNLASNPTRPPPRVKRTNRKKKTQQTRPCKYYNGNGCTRSDCTFLHVCMFFHAGNCKFGKDCRRNHFVS